MAQDPVNVGTAANDGTGDPLRDAFIKINAMFAELYSASSASSLRELPMPNFSSDGAVKFYADVAMTLTQQSTSGTGTVAYEKSTAAAPGTFASTSSPITLEAGAWLKVIASGVTGGASDPFSVALKRTA